MPEPARRQRRFTKTLADLERSREASDAQILPEPVEAPPSLWSRLRLRRKDPASG